MVISFFKCLIILHGVLTVDSEIFCYQLYGFCVHFMQWLFWKGGSHCLVGSASGTWCSGLGHRLCCRVLPALWGRLCLWDPCASSWVKGTRLHCVARWLVLMQTPALHPRPACVLWVHTAVLRRPFLSAAIFLVPEVPNSCDPTESPGLSRTWGKKSLLQLVFGLPFSARALRTSLTCFSLIGNPFTWFKIQKVWRVSPCNPSIQLLPPEGNQFLVTLFRKFSCIYK